MGKENMYKKIVPIGIIILFIGTLTIPTITSTTKPDQHHELETQEFYCNIVRPTRALYLNDMPIWTFKLIQRGIVLGDITIEVDAIDETNGIEYVDIKIDGARMATIYDPPYQYLWDAWLPGFHILDARAFSNNGTFIDAESFQILKFG